LTPVGDVLIRHGVDLDDAEFAEALPQLLDGSSAASSSPLAAAGFALLAEQGLPDLPTAVAKGDLVRVRQGQVLRALAALIIARNQMRSRDPIPVPLTAADEQEG
jgi:hypothetical protein